jgi:hypothetical protein
VISSLTDYQIKAREFAVYPDLNTGNLWYPFLGLLEEAEEVEEAPPEEVSCEAGDVAWEIAQAYSELGLDLGTIRKRPDSATEHWFVGWQQTSGRSNVTPGFVAKIACKWHRDGENPVLRSQALSICEYFWLRYVDNQDSFSPECPDLLPLLAANIGKLQDRRDRGVLFGSGDHR